MKCLVLVMYCNQDFFIREEKKVRETWAKDILNKEYSNLDFFSYTASTNGETYVDYDTHTLYISCDDGLNGTTEKTAKCFKLLSDEGIINEYDFILRTNTSTYINVSLLSELMNSNLLNTKLVYGGDIYCSRCFCGPYNYSYYAVGNCMILPTRYMKLFTMKRVKQCIEKYYNVIPDNRGAVSEIDDLALGFVINCYAEYKLNIYHKDMYKAFGNNRALTYVNQYISTPIRIYNGDREKEFELYDLLHSVYDKSTNLNFVRAELMSNKYVYE